MSRLKTGLAVGAGATIGAVGARAVRRFRSSESSSKDESGVWVPMVPAEIERIRLEVDQGDHTTESIEDFVRLAIKFELSKIDRRIEQFVEKEVDVSPANALRARLHVERQKQQGEEIEDEEMLFRDYLNDYTTVNPQYNVKDHPHSRAFEGDGDPL